MVPVTVMYPGKHHCGSFTHFIIKQAPQVRPLLNKAVLNAAVFVPYPWLYRFPYPQAPPTQYQNTKVDKKVYDFKVRICDFKLV